MEKYTRYLQKEVYKKIKAGCAKNKKKNAYILQLRPTLENRGL